MLNTAQIQKETLRDTTRLGYEVDKNTTIEKLYDEIQEFKTSTPIEHKKTPYMISNIRDDKEFVKHYKEFMIGTEEEELPDLIKVIMSYCESKEIDLELMLMMKHRYNKFRNKK